ncbi:UBC-like protein [Basidiobolus meristosporus CBS 931.73]|uniref:UBC-like protein n=1 Tax=Basidiobolus meristosporus CBS 931.73 TaxID=1314790 RepID=A0A1Y1YLV1_9FUNG|nr:UBC-like protein [Basidiobolus meristosporus CBS 931.73]|eukprot:ORX98990.1 UBC-like protein [Basidiobolus meristosporus CBS 931.73]
MALYSRRLLKELKELTLTPPSGIKVVEADDLDRWTLKLEGASGTLYEGETFELEFRFTPNYPMESPAVVFIGNVPIHPHVYSNGHICLNILYTHWTPAQTVSTVCLSLLSMLSSCKRKERPPDNDGYVGRASQNPKKTKWAFHDDEI